MNNKPTHPHTPQPTTPTHHPPHPTKAAPLTKEADEVDEAVDVASLLVLVLLEDVGVLWPLKLVQELCPEHYVEVLAQAGHHLLHGALPGWMREGNVMKGPGRLRRAQKKL